VAKRGVFAETAHSTVATVRDFGAMLLPFTDKEQGAARINASLRSFAKPGTWFAPMWAVMVGVVASPHSRLDVATVLKTLVLMVMAGPLLCAFSQVINDHYDREVDKINEPLRPTASDLLGGRAIAAIAAVLALLAIGIAFAFGPTVGFLAIGGLVLAWAYSAPPLRLKALDGWLANGACAFAYEGFAWLAGTAAFGKLTDGDLILAALFSMGAHGLMTLNDFKSLRGDRELGLRSLPVILGEKRALGVAVWFINLFQAIALAFVFSQGYWIPALIMNVLLLLQLPMQNRLARNPARNAPWYCASAIPLFCWSMLAGAFALRLGGF
jgi:chlorophyll synthase